MNDQTLRKQDGAQHEVQANETPCEGRTETQVKTSRRPRSMTTLKLQWLAERARKVRAIKDAVDTGTYKVDSKSVAKAVLGIYEDE